MKIKTSIILLSVVLVSCQSKQAEKSNVNSTIASKVSEKLVNGLPANFKFSLFISGTGNDTKPPDSWTIDTGGIIAIHTSYRISHAKSQDISAMAALDARDMDTIRQLIRNGKLFAIDSNNLTQQCAGDEHYLLRLVPLAATQSLSASFDACAADYNLLLEPQRQYFRKFIDWWERMRVKYRPNQTW